ncbi:thioesterase family protein [Nocardia iowensis]|uniref:Thioesterase family protein n=1 Tax=Nocardia iowensis TaxID=204891 RepID=A0ABX8RHN9_NOCIO|nr:thioesterase family protein [Nocardia iowensis]QXN88459.1 thioesterase family protein [Nocardia iowensis]
MNNAVNIRAAQRGEMTVRPRYDSANIRTWVGFKQFMCLVEEAVLQWFRDSGLGPGTLFHDYGLGLEIVDSSVLLPAVLDIDDQVTAEVSERGSGRFQVRLTASRGGTDVLVARATVTVALVRERGRAVLAPPPDLVELVVGGIGPPEYAAQQVVSPGTEVRRALGIGPTGFLWSWRVPYFYCHYSDRLQHSGYVRALEDVVDRFLDSRGISVGRMLADRGWIPVVSKARVHMLADVHMEETVHTTFTVEEILRGISHRGRMDCYVERDATMVHTATAGILHGYAIVDGPGAGTLAEFDPPTIAALLGDR